MPPPQQLDQAALAAFVRARRRQLGLSPDQVADAIGRRPSAVDNLESGRGPVRMLSQYVALARVLRVSLAELLRALGVDVNARPAASQRPLPHQEPPRSRPRSRAAVSPAGQRPARSAAKSPAPGPKRVPKKS